MKIVLAYSGGLDTTAALIWLQERFGAEVVPYCASIGQSEDLEAIRDRARAISHTDVVVDNASERFLSSFAWPALRIGAAYQSSYLLAAPLSRPLIAEGAVRLAEAIGADAVAHGATGKGNDQIRFYASFAALAPKLRVLSPVVDWEFSSRAQQRDYLTAHGVEYEASSQGLYSVDTNIWGWSTECGSLDDLCQAAPSDIYMHGDELSAEPIDVAVSFEEGCPVALDGEPLDPVALVDRLNRLASAFGIGRIDFVEDRRTGIKTRGIYEAPAATVLHRARTELASIVLDRDTRQFLAAASERYAELVYDGLWFSPLRDALDALAERATRQISGVVTLQLRPLALSICSRESAASIYAPELATYEAGDRFDHTAGPGFAYMWSMPARLANQQRPQARR